MIQRDRREHQTAGEMVSALLQQALTAPVASTAVREPAAIYGFRPFPAGETVVTNGLIDELRRDDAY